MKILLCLLLCIAPVLADGGFVPHTGTLAPVEIPGQTAILAHKAGEETLTVWNTVKSDSAELAWVLPLPAAPSVIQQTDPRPMSALHIATAPVVELADLRPFWVIVIVLSYLSLLALFWERDSFPVRLALYVPIVLLLIFGGYGTSGDGPRAALPEVKVLAEQMTGNYETTVIKGTSTEAVNDWLKAREFPPLAGDQLEAVREYIAKGWVFLCAKLPPSTSGITAAHPLTVKFPSGRPVYPMRLTRSAGTVRVDVFLFADSEESGDASGRLTRTTNRQGGLAEKIRLQRIQMDLQNEVLQVAEPADVLLKAMQQTRFAGHFTATFGPGSDWSDVEFRSGVDHPPPPRYATRGALFSGGLALGAMFAGVGLFIFAVVMRLGGAAGKRPARHWKGIVFVLVLLPPIAGTVRAFFPERFSSREIRIVDTSAVADQNTVASDARMLLRDWVADSAAAPVNQ